MADLIQVARGTPPWQPSPDSELVDEYAYYDFPTAGVVRQHGTEYLFRCFFGADEDISFWIYTLVHHGERKLIDSAPDPETFDQVLTEVQSQQPATVVLAVDGIGIVAATAITYWFGDDPLSVAVSQLLDQVQGLATRARDVAKIRWKSLKDVEQDN
jgi:hypothetical protein